MPALRMIGPHLSISDLSKVRSDSGFALATGTGSPPRSASRALNPESTTADCSAATSLSSIGFGNPLGAHSPYQTTTSKPVSPCSSNVGRSGNKAARVLEVTPYTLIEPALICGVVVVV